MPQLFILQHIILLKEKVTFHVFSLTASNNKCPQNDAKGDIRKSTLFVVVGVLTILLGVGLFLDKQINGYAIYFIILVGIGVVVLLAGIYGVCFLYNIKLRKH
jgi:uncharacterized membrane protein HdeD (DUF308 family)